MVAGLRLLTECGLVVGPCIVVQRGQHERRRLDGAQAWGEPGVRADC